MAYEMGMYTVLAKYYDYIYEEYVRRVASRWADFVVDIIGPEGNVLDIACGTGAPTVRLIEKGLNVVCLDMNRPMLVVGRDRRLGRRVDYVEAAAERLPLRSSSFDAATMFFTSINYIGPFDTLTEFLSSVRSVLRQGGVFVFDTFNPLRPRSGCQAPIVWDTPGPEGEHLFIIDYREYDTAQSVILFKRLVSILKPNGSQRTFLVTDRLYAYTVNEFRVALRAAGFRNVDFYDGYRLVPYGSEGSSEGRRLVVVART